GETWSRPQGMSDIESNAQCSDLAMDASGGTYVVYSVVGGSGYRTYLRISGDGGATFAREVPVPVIPDFSLCPRIAAQKHGYVYFVWNSPGSTGKTDILFSQGPVDMP